MNKSQERIDFEEALSLDPTQLKDFTGTITEFFENILFRVNQAVALQPFTDYCHYGKEFDIESKIKHDAKKGGCTLTITFMDQKFTYDFDYYRAAQTPTKERAVRYSTHFIEYFIRKNTAH